jgi:hypothetical protein
MVLAPASRVLEEPLAALGDPDHKVIAVRPDGADLLRRRVEEGTAVLRVLKLPQELDAVLKGAVALVERMQGLIERRRRLVPEAVRRFDDQKVSGLPDDAAGADRRLVPVSESSFHAKGDG